MSRSYRKTPVGTY